MGRPNQRDCPTTLTDSSKRHLRLITIEGDCRKHQFKTHGITIPQ